MATPLADLLQWFLTGKKPTQQQFDATFRSFWHKDEQIPTSKIEALDTTLNQKAERQHLETHLTDPDAHSELFAQIYTPHRRIVLGIMVGGDNIVVPELIGVELDVVSYQNQTFTDGLSFDPLTGTISGWDFMAGTKIIIDYTKL